MGIIKTTYDVPRDLTLVKARGGMTAHDFISWETAYLSDRVTALILWDLSNADLCDLSGDEIRTIAARTNIVSVVRQGGKTAFVLGRPCSFGVGRMLEAYNEVAERPSEIRAFHTVDDARKWLGV